MKIAATVLCIAIVAGSGIAFADAPEAPLPYAPSEHQILMSATAVYHAPYAQISTVGHCESGTRNKYYNQDAVGAQGEIGAFQFKQSTWDSMTAQMGEKLDIHSFADQARVVSWVFSSHPEWRNQWSTWRAWYGLGLKRCMI